MPRLSFLSCLLKPLSLLPRGPSHAAYAAALALVVIQVGIGIIIKASQSGGSYAFSPSASITISEFLKLLLSSLFFYNECRVRAADGTPPSSRGTRASSYAPISGAESSVTGLRDSLEEKRAEEGTSPDFQEGYGLGANQRDRPVPMLALRAYWAYVRGELTVDVRYGFCKLALFYVLINNLIFVIYKVADPGTIQLTRSGVTFITALVMTATLGTNISKLQWIAIVFQVCGLATTQYDPQKGTTYPLGTYLLLFFQVFLGAAAGVYNQALLKADGASLHAGNMMLYLAGVAVNVASHVVVRAFKSDEPGFFDGYNSFGAVMVIVNNVLIGLAITAVYKYADAIIKCFASAIATAILLYVSPLLFDAPMGGLLIPGTLIVFVASWLYMDNPPPKSPQSDQTSPTKPRTLLQKFAAVLRLHNKTVLASATFVTIIVVAFITMLDTKLPDSHLPPAPALPAAAAAAPTDRDPSALIQSPFQNTLALVRWNTPLPERIPLVQKYRPFFHTLHLSMPGSLPAHADDPAFHNLTHDQHDDAYTAYAQVARTMKLLLDHHPDVSGLLYYHFDAWIHPLAFSSSGLDPAHIWFPDTLDVAPPDGGGPNFMCMNDTAAYNWWGWSSDIHKAALVAADVVANLPSHDDKGDNDNARPAYSVVPGEWCVGWSDIYYIPRRFFPDFILLTRIFASFGVFHEVALPTIATIIDRSRRANPHVPVLDRLADCWGSCCAEHPSARDVLWRRCGHRLDFRDSAVADVFFDALDRQASWLGKRWGPPARPTPEGFDDAWFDNVVLANLGEHPF